MFDPKQIAPAANGSTAAPPLPVSVQSAHPLDRLSILFRHRRLAIAAFAITVGLMMAQTYSTIPQYRARAQILIQDERSTAVGALNANDPSVLAGSRAVLQHAVPDYAEPRASRAAW